MGAVVATSTVAVAVIAGAAVLERADEAPALAMGRCVWAVQECEASLALEAVFGEREKVAPALADGGSAYGRCRSARHHLPWRQCLGRERR